MIRPAPSSTLFPYTTLFRSASPRSVVVMAKTATPWGPADLVEELIVRQQAGDKRLDRKSTRLNSSHVSISYAVFCLKKKNRSHVPRRGRCRVVLPDVLHGHW